MLDYDPNAGEVDTRSVEAILAKAGDEGYRIVWSLETHAHADHLSGSPYIKAKTGARIGIGEHIAAVQRLFRPVFNATDLRTDGSDFDHLFKDGETFLIGTLEGRILHTPGHTPADIVYLIGTQRSLATRCSCRTTARRALTSRAETRAHSTARSRRSCLVAARDAAVHVS